ncbi:MAG: PQQ-dependent dehydrogenase, methanol/ethanol family [Alphaproteobacteria bacterium]|nr:PQQ-dependent dehydrogenase, methanol/ethanol family [Alphaproteobacteria bacterium]MBL7097121.1 PQQ-dependent dehydrogenase, methanol/ethanol family [Alphaproteobacteria bacterium]
MGSWVQAGFIAAALLLLLAACGPDGNDGPKNAGSTTSRPAPTAPAPDSGDGAARLDNAADVDGDRIIHADNTPGDWLSYGRTYSEQRFSPLKDINRDNVKQLGVAWEFRTNTTRGLESTPIVSNGVMFVTGSWSKVWALDARTGRQLWFYDPEVPGKWGRYACCDVVNRGVAVWKGAVYVGTLDGRLVKLDARTGKPVWDINTIDRNRPYTITGAPRVVKGMVLIGNGGAEYGVRGYITAYDADTGRQIWRFYVVPGNPALPPEDKAMADAMHTWSTGGTANHWWDQGGGGTPWDSMAYDPDLDLLYVGTGNGGSWNRNLRSPGGGDNLYLSSIVALKPDTGELVWYYQTTPGDDWDYTATQHIILADLMIDGVLRKVLMQAPKNGFFYVIDRATGKLISAQPYTTITWARGVDMATGRPIENPGVRYGRNPSIQIPGPVGAHNWQPMSYDPETGLVYIPVIDSNFIYAQQRQLSYKPGAWNTSDFAQLGQMIAADIAKGQIPPPAKGYIRAWDPVTQKMVWQVEMSGGWNSGLLSTAGGLVFFGGSDGMFGAYDAKTGAKLWAIDLKTGMSAPAITYTVDGEQYIAIAAAFGGSGGLGATSDPNTALQKYGNNQGRIFAFKIGGNKVVNPMPSEVPATVPAPPAETVDPKLAASGFTIFHHNCAVCHGVLMVSSGEVPDLRTVAPEIWNQYDEIVLDGALQDSGMASFKDILSETDVKAVRAYALQQAQALHAQRHPATPVPPTRQSPSGTSSPP